MGCQMILRLPATFTSIKCTQGPLDLRALLRVSRPRGARGMQDFNLFTISKLFNPGATV